MTRINNLNQQSLNKQTEIQTAQEELRKAREKVSAQTQNSNAQFDAVQNQTKEILKQIQSTPAKNEVTPAEETSQKKVYKINQKQEPTIQQAIKTALKSTPASQKGKIAQGKALLQVAKANGVELDSTLESGVKQGLAKALQKAQAKLKEQGVLQDTSTENKTSEVKENSVEEKTTKQSETPSKQTAETDSEQENSVDTQNENKKTSEENENSIVKVTGNEFGEYNDIKELRKKAIKYYKENLQGTSVENKTLGKIDLDENGLVEFTTAGRKKVESTSAQEQKLLLVKHLPTLIKNAADIEKAEPIKERHKDDIFYYLSTSAEIDGQETPVYITLVKHNTGRIQFYNHSVKKEDTSVNSAIPKKFGNSPVNVSSAENIPQSESDGKRKTENLTQDKFEVGEFTHSKTGEKIPSARACW